MTAPLHLAESAFAHYLPWWWAGAGVLVNHDGAISIGFRLEGVDLACQPDEQVNLTARHLRDLLNSLPIGFQLQFLVRSRVVGREAYRPFLSLLDTSQPILHEQRRRATDHFQALRLRRFDTYMLLTRPRALGRLGSHLGSGPSRLLDRLFARQAPGSVTREQHERAVADLGHASDTLTRYVAATGVRAARLSDRDLVGLAYAMLNPSRAERGTPALCDGLPTELPETDRPLYRALSLREQLAHGSLGWDVDLLYLDEPLRPHRVMGLKALPPRTVASLVAGARRIPFDHWLSIGVSVPDSETKFGEVERRRNRARASAAGFVRNVRADVQARELEGVLEAMVARDQRVFQLSLHVLFGAESLAELDLRTREVVDVFRGLSGTTVTTESYAQLPAFLGMMPGNAHAAPHKRTLLTDNAADFLPVYASWSGDGRPVFLVQTRAGEPFNLDIADPGRTNWNSTVFGQSGGGKTFLVLSLAASSILAQGSPLIVVDVGGGEVGSYYRLVRLLGGDFVDLSLDGKNAVNPFFSRADLFRTDKGDPSHEPNELKLGFLTGIASMLVSEPGAPPLTTVQEGILQRAILLAYRHVGDERPPVLSDLVRELEHHAGGEYVDRDAARGFARTLKAWIDGPYGKLLNQQSRVSIRSDFVVFDVKGLENLGRLAPVLITILSAYVWNMIARPRQKLAWLVYDECWKLLQNEKAAALQSELYRTARKLRAGVISVTQKLEDFLSSPAAEAILSNSTTTFLLKHRDGHDTVAERVGLNDRERELFRTLRTEKGHFAEFFYKTEYGSAVLRNSPSAWDYWMSTTDPRDRDLEARVLAEVGGDRLAALRRLTREYPNGAATRRLT